MADREPLNEVRLFVNSGNSMPFVLDHCLTCTDSRIAKNYDLSASHIGSYASFSSRNHDIYALVSSWTRFVCYNLILYDIDVTLFWLFVHSMTFGRTLSFQQ